MRSFIPASIVVSVTISLSACSSPPEPVEEKSASAPVPATATSTPTEKLKIIVLGDSISAGFGLAEGEAFPAVVQGRLESAGYAVQVTNAGVSGDTTAGGLQRLAWLLQQKPDILVVELGANDGLRGQPLANIESNLREIVRRGQEAGAQVVLLGIDVPTNYGPAYSQGFAGIYQSIAESENLTWIPGFLHEVGTDSGLMQPDGLHPTAAGQEQLADQVTPVLEKVMDSL